MPRAEEGKGAGDGWRGFLGDAAGAHFPEAAATPAPGWGPGLGPLELVDQGLIRLRASGPCGAQMRQLGPQRDMDVSHLSYSAGVGRGQRQGTGDFRGKAEDEGSSQTCPCPVTSPVPLIEVTITDLRKRHSLA